METDKWPNMWRSVATLHLDAKNSRLGHGATLKSPREIIQYLFKHDKALELALSITARGYFPNEPLLAIKEGDLFVVVEGNRRLAALKALQEPGLLEGSMCRQLENLSRQIDDLKSIAWAPVILAPSRRATDRQIAGKHIGTPVLAWQAENRASFILNKLNEGYTNEQLKDQLGFKSQDIQSARQTRAIADMARSLDLPPEIKAKLNNPRVKLFTTLERVFNSSVGREYLMIETDSETGIRGMTTKDEFLRGFKKLVYDVVHRNQSSRTLNTNENIRHYFDSWESEERPKKKDGSFVPDDITQGSSTGMMRPEPEPATRQLKSKKISKTVLPRDFKIRFGSDRLIDIRRELIRLKREEYPNAGAVLLRVFFELAVLHYLDRRGELPGIISDLEQRRNGHKLPYNTPTLKDLNPVIIRIANEKLKKVDATKIKKAISHDPSAPFSIGELHGFVHQSDLPSARDILQFWNRTEPLFRLMLEKDEGEPTK